MGQQPNPAEQRRLTGNPEHRPIPDEVVVGGRADPGTTPRVPDRWVSKPREPEVRRKWKQRRREVWREWTSMLVDASIYAEGDRYAVEQAVELYVRAEELAEQVELWREEGGMGFMTLSARGTTTHPLVAQELAVRAQLRHYLEAIGLTALARTKLGKKAGPTDPMEKLRGTLGGGLPRRPRLVGADDEG